MTRLFLVVSCLSAGCASTSDVKTLQSQIADLQQELVNVKQTASSKEEMQSVNRTIAQQTQALLTSNAALVTKVDRMEETIQNTQGAVEQIGNRVDRLVQQLEQAQRDVEELKSLTARLGAPAGSSNGMPPISAVNVPPPASSGVEPIQMYQDAMRDYQRGNYDLAIAGFRDFLSQSATSDLADNASYWIGESLFSQKKYREAIEQFDSVVTRFPKSDKVPGSLLKKGISYINLGERAPGVVQLQYVVHEHPTSQEATIARQRLRALGVETK